MGLRMETPKERASAFFLAPRQRETIGKASWRSTLFRTRRPSVAVAMPSARRPHAPRHLPEATNLKAPRVHWCLWLTLVLRLSCGRLAPALRCSCAQSAENNGDVIARAQSPFANGRSQRFRMSRRKRDTPGDPTNDRAKRTAVEPVLVDGRTARRGPGASERQRVKLARVLRGGCETRPPECQWAARPSEGNARETWRQAGIAVANARKAEAAKPPARVGAVYHPASRQGVAAHGCATKSPPSPAGAGIPARPEEKPGGTGARAGVGPHAHRQEEEARVEAALDRAREQFREKRLVPSIRFHPKEESGLMPGWSR